MFWWLPVSPLGSVAICGFFHILKKKPKAVMQTICEQILTDTLYYRQIPVLTYRIAYPAFTTTCNPAAAQRINEMYAAEAKEAQAYCRTALFADAAEQVRYFFVSVLSVAS